jgi:two-component system, cell cycle sensor histidine kinase and response regulator CckA
MTTWNVLMVEDSPSDAKLILAELRRNGKVIEFERVEDEPSLRRCLTEGKWDVVLSDWSLPGFSAPLALALLKQLQVDLPFIIVSGTVGEEMAVEAMRAGASDYILKDRIARLVPAIERELRERSARRNAAEALVRSEEQLRQAQKMEAVGRLAAGVAHDFNNLLSVILGYAELLVAKLHESDPVRRDIEEIDAAASRAAELTRQLLMFSRQQVLEPSVIDLNALLRDLERMLGRVLGEDVELSLNAGDAVYKIRADRASLEQAIMNLVVNARDAMPTGGKLTIETSQQLLDEEYARGHLGVTPGPYVSLVVTDTGIGMDAATQARMFEPFFTTKDKNTGTGLGLSMVLGFVHQSGGSIWAYSEPNVGTTFKVFLPCAGTQSVSERPKPKKQALTGTETILLVEDESQVRTVAARILRSYGYHVLETHSPEEALLVGESHPGPIDLLLSDVVMPKMSGPELAARLLQLRPDLKLLYMSGYTDHSVLQHGILREEVAYLQKPITPSNLTAKVREVLTPAAALPEEPA